MFFNWFRKSLKVVRLFKGSGGNHRWTARIDGHLMAVCRVQGYESPEEAKAAAQETLGGGWGYELEYDEDQP